MKRLTVATLDPSHHNGRRATVGGRTGLLIWAANPAYPRLAPMHWYLSEPCPLPQFEHQLLSLQWSDTEPVTLLD